MNRINKKIQKGLACRQAGFTLIELLIVIAVLGVLATVVLVAIDPIEQLRRGRDTGRLSSVTQLGHGIQQYVTGLGTATYPVVSNTWQTTYLLNSGETSQVVTLPSVAAGNCTAADAQGNICYVPVSANAGGIVWATLESKSSFAKGTCAVGTTAVAAYDTTQGIAGIGCVADATTPPGAGIVLR